jgi:hypothetical protein
MPAVNLKSDLLPAATLTDDVDTFPSSQRELTTSFSKLSTFSPVNKGKSVAFIDPDKILFSTSSFPLAGPSTSRPIISDFDFINESHDEEILSLNDNSVDDEAEGSDTEPLYSSFGTLYPRVHTFTDIYPDYPNTHIKGHATIVEIPPAVLTTERIQLLLKRLQYSLSNQGGGGKRIRENIAFFNTESQSDEDDNDGPSMNYHSRTCAGVKVCEYFPAELQQSHTMVEPDSLEWARLLAEQERTHSNSAESKVDKLYDEYIDDQCDRPKLTGISLCGGKTVIRSRNEDISSSLYHRLFIGCEHWRPNEKGHTRVSLDGCDPAAILKRWGRNRCYVHRDILEKLNIVWDDLDGIFLSIFLC